MLEVFEDTEDIEEDYDDDVADQDYVCTGNSDTSDDEEMLTKVWSILYTVYNSRSNVVLKESPKNNNVLLSPLIESIRISVVVVKTINGK